MKGALDVNVAVCLQSTSKIFSFRKAKKIQLLLIVSDTSGEGYKIVNIFCFILTKYKNVRFLYFVLLFLIAGLRTHKRWISLAFLEYLNYLVYL